MSVAPHPASGNDVAANETTATTRRHLVDGARGGLRADADSIDKDILSPMVTLKAQS